MNPLRKLFGLGQVVAPVGTTTTTTQTTTANTNWTPWIIGGVAATALGAYAYYYARHHGYSLANPTRMHSLGEYRASVANLLMRRYGFSFAKIHASFTDPVIEGKLESLFRRRRTVEYAALSVHRGVRRKFYKPWKKAGYMPLRLDLPPGYSAAPTGFAAER